MNKKEETVRRLLDLDKVEIGEDFVYLTKNGQVIKVSLQVPDFPEDEAPRIKVGHKVVLP